MDAHGDHDTPLPAISQLPTELLIQVLHWVLPSTDLMLHGRLHSYMRILYTLRLVVKRWQEIIDGTPTFWTFVLSSLPPHVNDTTILRSNNGPLAIVYSTTTGTFGDNQPRPRDFLQRVAHTYPRWSAYRGRIVPEYLEKPAPLLRYVSLEGMWNDEPLELLGGYSSCLRYVELFYVRIRWKMGLFTQLNVLKLTRVGGNGLTTGHLLDFLHASPCLEHLELESVLAATSNLDYPSAITLPRLRWIKFHCCGNNVVEAILFHIRAPSCITFWATIINMDEPDVPKLLNQTFQHFQGKFYAIHQRAGFSEIRLDESRFQWASRAGGWDGHQFGLSIDVANQITCIRWVERILHNDSGLRIHFGDGADTSDAVLETIAPMRCVTRLQIGGSAGREDTLRFLRLLGERRSTEPSLPSLRELRLTSVGWDAQDLIDMVHSRFDKLPGDTMERSFLSITMAQGVFTGWPRRPRPILEYTMLTKLRNTNGVTAVRFLGPGESHGMLGVTWDEGASKPVRG